MSTWNEPAQDLAPVDPPAETCDEGCTCGQGRCARKVDERCSEKNCEGPRCHNSVYCAEHTHLPPEPDRPHLCIECGGWAETGTLCAECRYHFHGWPLPTPAPGTRHNPEGA